MAPMTLNQCPKHVFGTEVTKYYRRRAQNHVGLIITAGGGAWDFVSMRIKRETPKGSKRTIHELLDRLSSNEFELVGVGRALLADPAWVAKVIENRFDQINTFKMESLETFY